MEEGAQLRKVVSGGSQEVLRDGVCRFYSFDFSLAKVVEITDCNFELLTTPGCQKVGLEK